MDQPQVNDLVPQLVETEENMMQLQQQISTRVAEFQNQLVTLQTRNQEIREAIRLAFEATGRTDPYEDSKIRISYVKPSERVGVDMDRLRVEQPDIAEKYKKITNVKSSIRIKVK